MADATALLRLLEPAVRPAGLPVGGASAPSAPSAPASAGRFDALLAERIAAPSPQNPVADPSVQFAPDGPAGTPLAMTTPDPSAASPLTHLAGIDRVENPALRTLLGQRAA